MKSGLLHFRHSPVKRILKRSEVKARGLRMSETMIITGLAWEVQTCKVCRLEIGKPRLTLGRVPDE